MSCLGYFYTLINYLFNISSYLALLHVHNVPRDEFAKLLKFLRQSQFVKTIQTKYLAPATHVSKYF
jgi:hypothetical protein